MAYAGLLYRTKWLRRLNELLEEIIRLNKNIESIKGLKKKSHPEKSDHSHP